MTEALTAPSPQTRTHLDAVALFLAHWRGSMVAVFLATLAVMLAGRDYASFNTRLVWCLLACINYLAQSFVSWKLEREPSLAKALPHYMPWLLISVSMSGLLWGSVPWLVEPASTHVLVFVSLFNIMLLFSVANAPATASMLLSATVPFSLLTTTALAIRCDLIYAAGNAMLSGLILAYGLRVQAAIGNTMMARHAAADLAEQLHMHQQQLLKFERENALLLERQRLMHDMHDGLGSVLLSTLAAIEQRHMPQEAVAEALRSCVEDLRLVIDSLEPMEHDLVTLLATIRYRLGQRLDAAGLALEWDIHDLPPLPWLESPESLHVLRLVQEALTNVLKHAQASRVRVATRNLGNKVEIHIEDDGCGFDPDAVTPGRGLRSQNRRAERLGGELQIDSAPDRGTSLRLQLPVNPTIKG